ncbi:hypothetical protein PI126_g16358 [Phytophthora idaei]|nr:hypothetical protein PI126_g16358 [Phytophthora idaei]
MLQTPIIASAGTCETDRPSRSKDPEKLEWLVAPPPNITRYSLTVDIVRFLSQVALGCYGKSVVLAEAKTRYEGVVARVFLVESHPFMQRAMAGALPNTVVAVMRLLCKKYTDGLKQLPNNPATPPLRKLFA